MNQKPSQQSHGEGIRDKRGCPREMFRIWGAEVGMALELLDSDVPAESSSTRLPFSPTKLPDLTPKPSQLCKLLPFFMQSVGCSPGFGANQGLHPKNSARTLTLKKKKKTIYKQQKKLCQGLLLKSASSQNSAQTFRGSGDANPTAYVSFEGQKDKISTYSSSG